MPMTPTMPTTPTTPTPPRPLPVIEIESPCPADWQAMSGDDRVKFCSHCRRDVHDLSALRSDEVEELICRAAGRLCVRFQPTPDGKIKTLDYAPPKPKWRAKHWLVLGVLAALGAGGARAAWQRQQQPPMLMGMAPPRTVLPSPAPAGLPAPVCPTP